VTVSERPAPRRHMKLGLSLASVGYHHAAWRNEDVPADGDMSFAHMVRCAAIADAGKFDFVLVGDETAVTNLGDSRIASDREQGHVKLEPLTALAALAAVTSRIGLIATASTSWQHPFHVARRLASIDHVSEGRAGWNVVTDTSPDEAQNYTHAAALDSRTNHARAREFLSVVRGLFGSWERDAFPRDRAGGIYMDRARLHRLEHRGKYFGVRGPMDVDRPPQGMLPIVTGGTSNNAQEFAAEVADLVYVAHPTLEDGRSYYSSVKARLPRYGRTPDSLRVMPGITPIVGRTQQEADDKFDILQQKLHPQVGFGMLMSNSFPDLRDCNVDAPMPPIEMNREHGIAGNDPVYTLALMKHARQQKLTIRQLFEVVARGFPHLSVIGAPQSVADVMEEWFNADAADGFVLLPAYLPGSAEDFVTLVLPELRRRGLVRSEYEGHTLRENLGLSPVLT
jgi:FMN-dependent oxidoreductase (nitrilotriacetate monooxygenase family)